MSKLSNNWITEKHVDSEYKRYILLAYLKQVKNNFKRVKLYPYYSELLSHYKQLTFLKENTQNIFENFPERVEGMDWQNLNVIYRKNVEDDSIMQEIKEIINYSIPKFENCLNEGKKIYEFLEEQIQIDPIGIIPLYPNEGYLLLRDGKNKETRVYEYRITIYETPDVKYKKIHTKYLMSYQKNFINTLESIKVDLIRNIKKFPNPATYSVETQMTIPLDETFLPIAKQILVKYIASGEC